MADQQQQQPNQTQQQSPQQPLAKPRTTRPRPESTVVQSFMDDLDSMFGLTPEVEELEDTINAKKQTVSSGERELRELEARLRETEKRLARVSRSGSPAGFTYPPPPPPPKQSDIIGEASTSRNSINHEHTRPAEQHVSSPLAQTPGYPVDRPLTGKRQDMPGAMASAPHYAAGGVTSDYVMVGRS